VCVAPCEQRARVMPLFAAVPPAVKSAQILLGDFVSSAIERRDRGVCFERNARGFPKRSTVLLLLDGLHSPRDEFSLYPSVDH
jgi:hypothetical protein